MPGMHNTSIPATSIPATSIPAYQAYLAYWHTIGLNKTATTIIIIIIPCIHTVFGIIIT